MNTSKQTFMVVVITTAMLLGCSDSFFERPPTDSIVEENYYTNEDDLFRVISPMYNIIWFDFNDKAKIEIGDARAGNMMTNDQGRLQFIEFSTTSDNMRLNELWRSLYIVVNYANIQIHNIADRTPDEVSEVVINHRIAEARFMRGVAYYYLATLWGDVPIITSSTELLQQPNVRLNYRDDVMEFAIRDMLFAEEHLVLNDPAGRVTQWSAKAMLSRFYLTRAHFDSNGGNLVESDLELARQYALDVIENSSASLMDNYADLFKTENNNNPESLFALQWVHGSGEWGTHNSTQAYYAVEARLTGVGDGWGGGTSVSAWLFELFGGEDSDDLRRKATFMLDGDHYPELLQSQGGYDYNSLQTGNPGPIKKYVVGTPDDNDGRVGFMSTEINTYMMRLAEVYLNYAQAVLGNNSSTSDGQALMYFNMVHERAGHDPVSSITYDDILEEKFKEFAFEGQLWYELVRLHNWQPDKAIEIVTEQQRMIPWSFSQQEGYELEDYDRVIIPNESDFKLAYPEAELTSNPLLRQDPVSYDFD